MIAASAAGSHAVARTEDRTMLLAAVALHQAGAALPVPPPLLHAFARDASTAPLAAPSPVV